PPAAAPLPAGGGLLFSALIGLAAARRLSRETQWSKAVAVSAMTPLGRSGASRKTLQNRALTPPHAKMSTIQRMQG
ncbi:MAG: hypothetical protein AAF754_14505, partial [Pseudomonadota bacterium]